MTAMQRQVYCAIRELIAERGFAPSIREIGERVGLSSSATVSAHLYQLRRAGFITSLAGSPRTIALTSKAPEAA